MQRCGLKIKILLHNSRQKLHHSHIYPVFVKSVAEYSKMNVSQVSEL